MDDSITRFRDKYIEITKTYHIKNSAARGYVMCVEANKGLQLTRHNADDINHYLHEIGRKGYLQRLAISTGCSYTKNVIC